MKQINFSRQWHRIEPWLCETEVKYALWFGLKSHNHKYRIGDPPYREGRWSGIGQRAKPGRLSWYQPQGGCHAIAPFAWAVSRRLYPMFTWGFLTSSFHTVAVGVDDQDKIKMVADILLFKTLTAEQSISFVTCDLASLCFNADELLRGEKGDWWTGLSRQFGWTEAQKQSQQLTEGEYPRVSLRPSPAATKTKTVIA